jgi:MFS family permease
MSDLVAAVSSKLSGAPEELIVRSAQARAQAQGVSVDEVLAAWAGDGGLAAAAPAGAPVADEPTPDAPVTEVAPVPSPVEAAPAAAAAPPEVPVVAAATAVAVMEPAREIEPGTMGERLRTAAKVGAPLGALLGLFAAVISAPLVVSRVSTVGDPAGPAIEVTPLAAALTLGVASAVFGAVIAVLARSIGGFVSAGHAMRGRAFGTGVLGALVGFVLGVTGMGILASLNAEGLDGTALLSVRSTVIGLILGGGVFGSITAVATQALGQPQHLADEEEASEVVRRRISNALFIPLVVALFIVAFVIPVGTILVRYASFAPWIAILVAGLILTFSSLMASRPNLRVTRGEVLTAVAGVGIVVVLLALIAAQLGGGHGEEAEHATTDSGAGLPGVTQLF